MTHKIYGQNDPNSSHHSSFSFSFPFSHSSCPGLSRVCISFECLKSYLLYATNENQNKTNTIFALDEIDFEKRDRKRLIDLLRLSFGLRRTCSRCSGFHKIFGFFKLRKRKIENVFSQPLYVNVSSIRRYILQLKSKHLMEQELNFEKIGILTIFPLKFK